MGAVFWLSVAVAFVVAATPARVAGPLPALGAASGTEPLLAVDDIREDLRFLVRTVEDVHPALSDAGRRTAFHDQALQAIERLQAPMPVGDLFFLAQRVLRSLPEPDAHTGLAYRPVEPVLPVHFRWVSDGLVVTQAAPGSPVRPGDVVVRLGGLSPEELLDELRHVVPAEHDGWVRARGEALIRQAFMLRRLGAMGSDGAVEVVIRRATAEPGVEVEQALSVGLVSPDRPMAPGGLEEEARPWFGWRIEPQHSLGFFWLDRCDDKPDYRQAVDDFFEAVAVSGVRKVAIDLRRNSGGNSAVTDAFLRYVPVDRVRSYRSRIRFSPEADRQRGYGLVARMVHAFAPLAPSTVRTPRPARRDRIFTGDLYILTSPHTFSSAVWFATVFSDNGLAMLVGEPTGGAPSSYGDILRFELPRSGMGFSVSHKRFTRPDPGRDPAETLAPDHWVPTTVESIRQRRDPQLEWVRAAGL